LPKKHQYTMERHFLSRAGAIAYLVHARSSLNRKFEGTSHEEGRSLQQRIDAIGQLILDVSAGRVDAFQAGSIEIFTTD
jgi:hypothetical protein